MKIARTGPFHTVATGSLALIVVAGACTAAPTRDPSVPSAASTSAPSVAVAPPAAPSVAEAPAPAPKGTETGSVAEPAQAQLLRIHGSNTIGLTLAPALAKGLLTKLGAPEVFVNAEDRKSQRIWVQGVVNGVPTSVEVFAPGTKVGFEHLASGECDIGMASRTIHQNEVESLSALGDMQTPAADHVIGLDGIAVIVNKANRVPKLTMKQIGSIFLGQITSWSQVGGSSTPIKLYLRDTKSGTFEAFRSMAMDGKDPKGDGKVFEDSEALSAEVAKDEGAIGFVGLPYVKDAKAVAVQNGDAMPMIPTTFSVATEDYALSRRLHLYTAENPKAPLVRAFIDYALSDDGQALVRDAGFVSLAMRAEPHKPPPAAPQAYVAEVTTAVRVSVDFRFKAGSTQLDSKAWPDLDRVIQFLGLPENKAKRVVLNGFTDNQGNPRVNEELSKTRAEVVAGELRKRGIRVEKVNGWGAALPLAPNDTQDGRERNRRVEVWLH